MPPQRRTADARIAALARRFGDVLRAGDGSAADAVMDEALAAGLAPTTIQSLVIAPAMARIGDLWELGIIGVADEHLATSLSQRALIRLFQSMSTTRVVRSGERVLLAAVEGQHHVLGLRMAADALEVAGYDVMCLGGDVPTDSLRSFIAQHRPAVVGLGFGVAADVSSLADALAAVHENAPTARIMLGGHAVPTGLLGSYPLVTNTMGIVAVVEALLAAPPAALPETVSLLRSDAEKPGDRRVSEVQTDDVAARLAKVGDEAIDLAREQVRRAENYRDLAFRDQLTELPNARAFDEKLLALTQDAERGVILALDVDTFKAINDAHGHHVGDGTLQHVARALLKSVRPGDFAARIGGDEFAVLLPGATEAVGVDVAERIRAAVARAVTPEATVSIGVATVTDSPRGSLLAADTALYVAKNAGRDRVAAGAAPVAPPQPIHTL